MADASSPADSGRRDATPVKAIDWAQRRIVIDERGLAEALSRFAEVVGTEHVVTELSALRAMGQATVPDSRRPSAIVYPGSADEVAQIITLAESRSVPLWPCSKGRNWGYGSAAPFLEGTVLLHLERLNRIIEVNEELAYAVIEPGVTYRQLKAFLVQHHPNLWCDCTDGPPDGSVVGNALERGLGVTSYGDHFATLCGLEVVLADGSLIRTGGGEPGHCHTWNTHKWGVGPYLEGLFSQSSLGVVTKAGVWLLRRPQAFVSFTLDLADEANLPRLVDVVRELSLQGVLPQGTHIVNDVVALAVVSQYPRELVGNCTRLPDAVMRELRKHLTIPQWSLGGGLYGTRAQVNAVRAELRRALRGLGRLNVLTDRKVRALLRLETVLESLRSRPLLRQAIAAGFRRLSGKSVELLPVAKRVHSVMQGIPSDYFVRHAYFKSPLEKPEDAHPDRDNCGLIWFAPIAPCTGNHVQVVLNLCKQLFIHHNFDFYAALLMQNSRSMIILLSIFYDKDIPAEANRAQVLYSALTEATQKAGYQQYRTGTMGMAALFSTAPEYGRFVRRLKTALDPMGILAPGKLPH